MKYTKLVLLFLIVFLLQSCGNKDNIDTPLTYNSIEISKDFFLGDPPEFQLEILDTINLEVQGNPSLTAVQDIAFSQNFFFLLDVKQGLLKFDYEGNLLRTIGAIGEGPEEYLMATAIYLDEKEKMIFVADKMKRAVISYDLEGSFNNSSQRLPGRPISLYNEDGTLLVIQESNAESRQVLLSSVELTTLEVKNQENPLYSYDSDFTVMHRIPRILSRVNEASLFYLPIVREDPSNHNDRDTIYRKVENHLVPEYLICFTGFDKADHLGINHVVKFDDYAHLFVVHNYRPYLVVVDLVSNRPLIHLTNLFDRELTIESIPRQFNGDIYYSILSSEEGVLEKNPMIVTFRIMGDESNKKMANY